MKNAGVYHVWLYFFSTEQAPIQSPKCYGSWWGVFVILHSHTHLHSPFIHQILYTSVCMYCCSLYPDSYCSSTHSQVRDPSDMEVSPLTRSLDRSTGNSSQGSWFWFSEMASFSLHFLFFMIIVSNMNHITKQLYSIIRCTTPPEATPPSRLPGLCPRPHTLSSPSPSPLLIHPSPLFSRPKHNQHSLGRCAFPSPLSHTLILHTLLMYTYTPSPPHSTERSFLPYPFPHAKTHAHISLPL